MLLLGPFGGSRKEPGIPRLPLLTWLVADNGDNLAIDAPFLDAGVDSLEVGASSRHKHSQLRRQLGVNSRSSRRRSHR